MTRQPHHSRDGTVRRTAPAPRTTAGGLAFVIALLAVLVVASYPLQAGAVVAGFAVIATLFRVVLPALARKLHGRIAELEVPGVGTVQIRVTPR